MTLRSLKGMTIAIASLLLVTVARPGMAVAQPPPPQTLCILDFNRLGDDASVDWLQRGLADMMIGTMNRIGPYQVVERVHLRDIQREHGLAATGLVGQGRDDLLTGPGPGAGFGPQARGWRFDGTAVVPVAHVNFYAYATPSFGVVVGGGDVDGDLIGEILTAPGPSPAFAPAVRGWDTDGAPVAAIAKSTAIVVKAI